MRNILQEIVENKKCEVAGLYKQFDFGTLQKQAEPSQLSFYNIISDKRNRNEFFFITEFKRRSPAAGVINMKVNLQSQVESYINAETSAISVLTDEKYFGGSYDDLKKTSLLIGSKQVLLLQKDFIIDPIQIYLARTCGANMILLIAGILSHKQIRQFKLQAEQLNMGVIVEIQSVEEFEKIKNLNCLVIGINNRDLNNFRVSLNKCNFIASKIQHNGFIIAESGIEDELDLAVVKSYADGFLIGTSLMKKGIKKSLHEHFSTSKKYFLKACGIREEKIIKENTADLIGINFSPRSKRKINDNKLNTIEIPPNAAAVFRNNSREEIQHVLSKHCFRYVQLYSDEIDVEFLKQIRQKVLLAVSLKNQSDMELIEKYSSFIHCIVLDSGDPGQGKEIEIFIPFNFPYPFFLAGGINTSNLKKIEKFKNCIGVDIASGIETNGNSDIQKIQEIKNKLFILQKEKVYADSNA